MANGWGGARAGSGPKKGPDGKAAKPYQRHKAAAPEANESSRTPVIEAKVVQDRRPMFSDEAVFALLESMKGVRSRSAARPRSPDWNPYIIRELNFGPSAKMAKAAKLAMDDNSQLVAANQFAVQAWQTGAALTAGDATDGMMFLGYSYLSQLLQRPEFRLFSEIMSEEMTRKWIDLRGTDDESTKEEDKPKDRNNDDEEADRRRAANDEKPRTDGRNKEIERKIIELRDFLDDLKVRQRFKQSAFDDQGYGIGHLYLDLKGADIDNIRDPENALSIGNGRDAISKAKLGRGCLNGLRTIEPIWAYPTGYNAANPLSPTWYDPQVWYVMGAEIHKTRLLPFIGRPVPDILKPAYAFGGLSMTQMAQPYVDIWLKTRESVGEIIHAFSVMVMMTDLSTTTQPGGSGGGNGDVLARLALFNIFRDNQGLVVLNKSSEDFKNISAPISGLDELQAQSQEHMCSVGRIPVVKFTGIDPKGLNATAEGSMRAFHDTVHGKQEDVFRVNLTTVLDIAQISLWGERDPDITYDFLPLHEETPKEKAEMRKLEAEVDQIRIDSGVVSQEEAREKLAADEESGYHGIDPDDVPDLLGEEEQGLIPEGAGKGLEAELGNAGGGAEKPPAASRKPGKPRPGGDDEGGAEDEAPAQKIAAGVVHRAPDGTVLLLRRSQAEGNYKGHWALPGGGADEGETPEEAAARENREEIGLNELGDLRKIDEVETPTGMRFHTFLHETEKFKPRLNAEHDGHVWAHPSRLPEPMHPSVKRVIGKLASGGGFDGAFDDWEEGKHPRDQGGKFTSGGGGGGAAAKSKPGKTKAGGSKPPASKTGGPNAAPQKPLEKVNTKGGNWKPVSGAMGTNPGGVFEDKTTGQKFYMKSLKSAAHAKNEVTAAKLYQLAGANTFEYVDTGVPSQVATKMEKLDKKNVSELSPAERKEAQKDFAIHAWLANWDAVGTGGDNVGVAGGKVKVLDVGGSLEYRAQGEPKGDKFGNQVTEAFTMMNPEKNPDAAALYGDMTAEQLQESAKLVTQIPDNAIRETVKAGGGDDALADKLIARKQDIAKMFGQEAAGATNPEWEALHPRGPGGKFAAKAGGEEPAEEKPSKLITSEAELNKLIAKTPIAGSNYRKALSDALKLKWITPEQKKALATNLVASWAKTMTNYASNGDTATAEKIGKKIGQLVEEHGLGKEEVKKAEAAAPPPPPPPPAPPKEEPKPAPKIAELLPDLPKPTEAELAKAKKNVALQLSYVPGEKPTGEYAPVANKMIEEFNKKYAGKEITDPDELAEKVNHFKMLQAGVNGLAKSEQEANAAKAEENKKKLAAQQAEAAKKLAKEKEEAKAENEKLMKDLGITETEALGFNALVEMHGSSSSSPKLVKKFQYYENEAKKHDYPISGFQYALLMDYIDGGYSAVNSALRSGSMTLAQHVYTKMMNDALTKLPKYEGMVERGTHLSPADIAKYKPGHVVQHGSFTSSGVGFKFSGNVHYKIKAIGKRGADVRKANSGESEVIFKANTMFLVHKVTPGTGGNPTVIEMEEVEAHG